MEEEFLDEQIMALYTHIKGLPWFTKYANYKVCGVIPKKLNQQEKKKFLHKPKFYMWDNPYLFKRCPDKILRRRVPNKDFEKILQHYCGSNYGGHYSGKRTATKVLQSCFYWPTRFKDAQKFMVNCKRCQLSGNLLRKHEMPQDGILDVRLFDIWRIDFMDPFPVSSNNKYILVGIDYVSKQVEAMPTPTNDSRVVITFLKKIFAWFWTTQSLDK